MKIHFSPNISFIIQADTKKTILHMWQSGATGGHPVHVPHHTCDFPRGALPTQCAQFAMDPARFMQQIKMSGTDLKRKD